MSCEYVLTDSTTSTTLTLPDTTLLENFGVEQNAKLFQPPGGIMSFVEGDGQDKITPFKIRFYVQENTESLARAQIANIKAFARQTTSVRRTSGTAYRAVHRGYCDLVVVPRSSVVFEVTLQFLPLFAEWTSTAAETITAYNAATKTLF